jgi:hypothetical protein
MGTLVIAGSVTELPLAKLQEAWSHTVSHFLVAKTFLPLLDTVAGSTYTIITGALALGPRTSGARRC